jgi:hypothetical protein
VDTFSISASEQNIASLSIDSPAPAIAASPSPVLQSTSDFLDAEEKLKLSAFESLDWIYCFMLDDLCYSVLKQHHTPTLNCPRHAQQSARQIAPDLAFEDIDTSLLISDSSLKIESLLGRGSFGSVFKGSLGSDKVAVKVLENLKSSATQSSSLNNNNNNNNEMSERSSNSKSWTYRKSIRLAAKAYTIARQEIAIVSSLKHENIVAMVGLSIQPLAIILELAPLGNLKVFLYFYIYAS